MGKLIEFALNALVHMTVIYFGLFLAFIILKGEMGFGSVIGLALVIWFIAGSWNKLLENAEKFNFPKRRSN